MNGEALQEDAIYRTKRPDRMRSPGKKRNGSLDAVAPLFMHSEGHKREWGRRQKGHLLENPGHFRPGRRSARSLLRFLFSDGPS